MVHLVSQACRPPRLRVGSTTYVVCDQELRDRANRAPTPPTEPLPKGATGPQRLTCVQLPICKWSVRCAVPKVIWPKFRLDHSSIVTTCWSENVGVTETQCKAFPPSVPMNGFHESRRVATVVHGPGFVRTPALPFALRRDLSAQHRHMGHTGLDSIDDDAEVDRLAGRHRLRGPGNREEQPD
jgi:hypothetical protein